MMAPLWVRCVYRSAQQALDTSLKLSTKFSKNKSIFKVVVPTLSTKSVKNTSKEICILETCSVSMNTCEGIFFCFCFFFQFTILRVIFVTVLDAPPSLKIFTIHFSKPSSRNFMFIHLVYNKDKITFFTNLFQFICILHKKVSTNNLRK